MTPYRHTQVGWAVIIPMLIIFLVVLGTARFSARTLAVIPYIVTASVVVLSLFSTLTVTITDEGVQCRFGVGLIRRLIRLSEIQKAEMVRNKWYYGWGIRLTPHGWLWNVAGLDAVELALGNGKRFRIGTDEPKQLWDAFRARGIAGRSR